MNRRTPAQSETVICLKVLKNEYLAFTPAYSYFNFPLKIRESRSGSKQKRNVMVKLCLYLYLCLSVDLSIDLYTCVFCIDID